VPENVLELLQHLEDSLNDPSKQERPFFRPALELVPSYTYNFPVFSSFLDGYFFTEDFLTDFFSWSDLRDFQRYHYAACIARTVETTEQQQEEKDEEEDTLEEWSFQFLLVCYLRDSGRLCQLATSTLERICRNPRRWLHRYSFVGGLFRQEFVSYLEELMLQEKRPTLDPIRFMYRLLDKLVAPLPEDTETKKAKSSHITDWMAFFEQYENWDVWSTTLKNFETKYQMVGGRIRKQAIFKPSPPQLTREHFQQYPVSQAQFDRVVSVTADRIILRFKGCVVHRALSRTTPLTDSRISMAVAEWLRQN
jgi:hypothetical protein